jgi:hypothetical protein
LKRREPKMDVGTFLSEYRKFLRDAQKQNPPLRPPYRDRRRKNQKKTGVFTAITPFDTARKGNLKNDLKQLPDDWAPDNTHFARLIPIEDVMCHTLPKGYAGMPPIRPCLVFGASFDGKKEDFLQELHEREHIWRHCDGWPEGGDDDKESFVDYLHKHEYQFDFPYSPYDGVPRKNIESALDLSKRVWKFAVDNQELTTPARAGELRQAWRAEFQ